MGLSVVQNFTITSKRRKRNTSSDYKNKAAHTLIIITINNLTTITIIMSSLHYFPAAFPKKAQSIFFHCHLFNELFSFEDRSKKTI